MTRLALPELVWSAMKFSVQQCREKAADKQAEAERNIGRRRGELKEAAAAWLLLASRIEEDEKLRSARNA